MPPFDGLSHYDVLGVSKTAAADEIRRAYKQLALKHHPDKDAGENATLLFQRILEAYEVLSSAQRILYDEGARNLERQHAAQVRAQQEQDEQRSIVRSKLIDACKSGAVWETLKMLRRGYSEDLNAIDEYGKTALIYASEQRCTQVVSLLILYQADVQIASPEGSSPLIFATSASKDEEASASSSAASCVSVLLRARAHPDVKNNSGMTPLLLSCASGNVAVAEALLSNKADACLSHDSGLTPLTLACDSGHSLIVRKLLETSAGMDAPDALGRTALMSASARGHVNAVAALVEFGADAAATDLEGRNALTFVMDFMIDSRVADMEDEKTSNRAAEICDRLIAAKADLHLQAVDGTTPSDLAETVGFAFLSMTANTYIGKTIEELGEKFAAAGC